MGIKFLGTVEIKENMTTEELDRKISEVIKDFQNGIEKKQQALSSSEDNVKSPNSSSKRRRKNNQTWNFWRA